MSFLDAVKASQSNMIYLVRAEEKPSGKPAWYYVRVHSKAKLPIFLEKVKTGLTLTDYGDVLYSGWGTEPPEEIKAKIKEQFG
jgi:hypothetical protein